MGKTIVIAIDGLAGAGKSTVAKIIAKKLDIEYVDSGAFYRAITKNFIDNNIKIEEYNRVEEQLAKISLKLESGRTFVNDRDLTEHLRTKEVSFLVSPVSSIIAVRKKVNEYLDKYSEGRSIIMDGRDIGTVVFPNADFKFYLDASVDIRAERRFKEKTLDLSLERIKEEMIKRDENDKNKEFGALKIASDAVYIDTTDLSLDEVVDDIFMRINE